jgi:hypothetical protein
MGAWWNSLEKVSGLNTWVLGFAAFFGFLAAILVIAGWFIGNRASDLEQAQLTQFRTDADTKIAAANQIAAQANEHAKQLEGETERLRSQNLEIQRKISPRFLTTVERETILEGIHRFPGHQIIIDRLGDAEAALYGDSIINVFEQARWAIQRNNIGVFLPPTYGIVCRISLHPDAAVQAVLEAFRKAKIDITLQDVPAAPQDSWIDILIGLKPLT